jgi:four helix bundle protein
MCGVPEEATVAAIARFEEVEAWQLGRAPCGRVYALCRATQIATDWGLWDQVTRAAGSVMHNIAEGFDAGSDAEFTRSLGYARRSCTEVQSE